MITLAVDCMGGDHGPAVVVPAVLEFLDHDRDCAAILVGREEALQPFLAQADASLSGRWSPQIARSSSWRLTRLGARRIRVSRSRMGMGGSSSGPPPRVSRGVARASSKSAARSRSSVKNPRHGTSSPTGAATP